MQPGLHKLLIPRWLRAWWPAVSWACVIFTLSTDSFSSEHTANLLSPVVRWLFPHLTEHQFSLIHHIIRKSAHFTEYLIFCLLIYRGVRGDGKGWRWTWGISALSVAAGYSIFDEIHQAFVASRTASPYDSLLDSLGAFFALGALYFWFRLRRTSDRAMDSSA
jgi:VanZ family protein